MSYSLDFSAVIDRLPELLLACLATIGLAIAGMSLATVIGVLGVVARRSAISCAGTVTTASSVFRLRIASRLTRVLGRTASFVLATLACELPRSGSRPVRR